MIMMRSAPAFSFSLSELNSWVVAEDKVTGSEAVGLLLDFALKTQAKVGKPLLLVVPGAFMADTVTLGTRRVSADIRVVAVGEELPTMPQGAAALVAAFTPAPTGADCVFTGLTPVRWLASVLMLVVFFCPLQTARWTGRLGRRQWRRSRNRGCQSSWRCVARLLFCCRLLPRSLASVKRGSFPQCLTMLTSGGAGCGVSTCGASRTGGDKGTVPRGGGGCQGAWATCAGAPLAAAPCLQK